MFNLEEVISKLPDDEAFLLPDFGYMWLGYVAAAGLLLAILAILVGIAFAISEKDLNVNLCWAGVVVSLVLVLGNIIPYIFMENNWYKEASIAMDEQLSSEELKGVYLLDQIFVKSYSGDLEVPKSDGNIVKLNVDGRTVTFNNKSHEAEIEAAVKRFEDLDDDGKKRFFDIVQDGK